MPSSIKKHATVDERKSGDYLNAAAETGRPLKSDEMLPNSQKMAVQATVHSRVDGAFEDEFAGEFAGESDEGGEVIVHCH